MARRHTELEWLRFQTALRSRLNRIDDDKALPIALKLTRKYFGAEEACIAEVEPGVESVKVIHKDPRKSHWDLDTFNRYLREEELEAPTDVAFAMLKRRGRPWAILTLRASQARFNVDDLRSLRKIAELVSELLHHIDRMRTVEVRSRIDRKVIEQLRPRDLFYQVLHGLRTLTRYDHSAAVLVYEPRDRDLTLVAEQIAWHKSKSRRIGRTIELTPEFHAALATGQVHGFNRRASIWESWTDPELAPLASALDHDETHEAGKPEMSMICAPLVTRDGLVGVLKVAALHPHALTDHEIDLIERFLPHVTVALQNLNRARTLELGMLEAERKHAMATVARGVAHDIHNAVGAVLPLVQQMLEDARVGDHDPERLCADLETIESSMQVTRRIFGGMLAFAREPTSQFGEGDLRRAIGNSLVILEEGMRKSEIQVAQEIADDLAFVRGSQNDLDRLVLNVVANARDAMPRGGLLRLKASADDQFVVVDVEDTGVGIPSHAMARIEEPFFTTKGHGNGLGLAICRSIVWNTHGTMKIDSTEGKGTLVRIKLPRAARAGEEGKMHE